MRKQHPGLYVGRRPARSRSNRIIIESIAFVDGPKGDREWTKQKAQNWADYIQSQYPKDCVFVFEVFERFEEE